METIAKTQYTTSDGIVFDLEVFHKKYQRSNHYKLYRNGQICADGRCPKTYTPRDIFNYWVRDEGSIETFRENEAE